MDNKHGYRSLLEICREMREAAAAEEWELLEQRYLKQLQLLKSLPAPTSADRTLLSDALADLQASISHASDRCDQLAGLLKSMV